jgi:DNA mismatch endonuclease Vsr
VSDISPPKSSVILARHHGLRSRDEGGEESVELLDVHRPAALAAFEEVPKAVKLGVCQRIVLGESSHWHSENSRRRITIPPSIRFKKHVATLPGKPDIVFAAARLAVFIDGDFWHGYRFRRWGHKLTPYWQQKIQANRLRDVSNFGKLRRRGWKVLRVWGHEIKRDLDAVIRKITGRLADS